MNWLRLYEVEIVVGIALVAVVCFVLAAAIRPTIRIEHPQPGVTCFRSAEGLYCQQDAK